MAERKLKLSDFTDAHLQDFSGKSHKEIVSRQNEELREIMRSPSCVPEFNSHGPVSSKPAVNVERLLPSVSGIENGNSNSSVCFPPPEEECLKIPQPKVYYEECLTKLTPVIVAEWEFKEFVWTTRLLQKTPPCYLDLTLPPGSPHPRGWG